jgi:hypothetical protein
MNGDIVFIPTNCPFVYILPKVFVLPRKLEFPFKVMLLFPKIFPLTNKSLFEFIFPTVILPDIFTFPLVEN